jgi:hypothetical protein
VGDSSANQPRRLTPADQIWKQRLRDIPTLFGQLVFLNSLRDASGTYREESLCGMFGAQEADRIIRHNHYQVFAQWLAYPLAEQKRDIGNYLTGCGGIEAGGKRIAVLSYRQIIPAAAHEVERQLYLADLETLLELLQAEQDGGSSSPKA